MKLKFSAPYKSEFTQLIYTGVPSLIFFCSLNLATLKTMQVFQISYWHLFCCSYAPYFWEAVQIRYPEYTKVLKNEKMVIDKEHKENENEYVCEIE